MIRLLINGCLGAMGRKLAACAKEQGDCEVVAGFDRVADTAQGFPVFTEPEHCTVPADVLIDFSHPSALDAVLRYAVEHHLPAVIATTGLSPEQQQAVRDAGEHIPVFFTANMSMGVSLLCELAKKAAAVLGDGFDVEILEKHHNQKVDAPSGTALMLADAVSEGLQYTPKYVFDRHSLHEKRHAHDIGFSSVRGGTIVGEHEVLFAGNDEVITLSHSAQSKLIFAVGAINAARFLLRQDNGFYTMADLMR